MIMYVEYISSITVISCVSKYLLCPPLFASTALILCGFEETRDRTYSRVIDVVHTFFIAFLWLASDVGFISETFLFIMVQRFSIGFKSGLDPCHGPRSSMNSSFSHLFTAAVR